MKTLLISLLMISLTSPANAQQPFTGKTAIIEEEFIFQAGEVPFPSCHASTIAETDNGLVASWFGGKHEKAPDVEIWVSRLGADGWSKPVAVADGIRNGKRYPTWNPVLFYADDRLLLFFKVGPNPREWWGEMISSQDGGRTWSVPRRLPDGIPGPIKDKPVMTRDGWLLAPSSTEAGGWRVHVEYSGDSGRTWTRGPSLNDPATAGLIQPTLLEHPGGRMQMLCRSRNRRIYTAWSQDKGLTWGPCTATELPNPNSGIDAVRLHDGRYLLVYNHTAKDKTWGDRNILNVALSDDGVRWQAAVLLENDPDTDSEYSYPAVIQTHDGKVHITYTWNRKTIKHVVLDPAKIRTKAFVDDRWPEGE